MQKRKIKKKVLFLFALVIVAIAYFGYTLYVGSPVAKLMHLDYTKSGAKLIIKNDLDKYILKNKIYSKTLEVALTEGLYEKDKLATYVFFEYKDYDKYIEHINSLKDLGYKNDEINVILEHLKASEVDSIITRKSIVNNLGSYIIGDNFRITNLDRYTAYKEKNSSYDYNKVIDYVNTNLDYTFYTHVVDVSIPDKDSDYIHILVNKYHKLSNDFVPKGLVHLSSNYSTGSNNEVIPVVKASFEEMCADMKSIGLTIKSTSTYRSYSTQLSLYNSYVARDGVAGADTYSARAGYSEHQTGLALDIYNTVLSYTDFDKTNEYTWLKDNAHKYGFIIRYQKGKESITGYKYEPWHLRYVGKDIATTIYNDGITFDEYYMKYIEK